MKLGRRPATLQEAFEAAISRYSTADWGRLNAKEQANAVYQEMRRLDAAATLEAQPVTTDPADTTE
jgi:hypothetical protein